MLGTRTATQESMSERADGNQAGHASRAEASADAPGGAPHDAYDASGVDLTLIRRMLALSPEDRLRTLEGWVGSILELRRAESNS